MSFLGSIAYFMDGSGLKQAFLYAEISTEKALSVHAFVRSIRGYILNFLATGGHVIDKCAFTNEVLNFLNNLQKKQTSLNITFLRNLFLLKL